MCVIYREQCKQIVCNIMLLLFITIISINVIIPNMAILLFSKNYSLIHLSLKKFMTFWHELGENHTINKNTLGIQR